MSGTFPATPKPASAEVTNIQPTVTSIAQSGKRQSRISGGQIWELTLDFPPMTREQFQPIDAFLALQRGSYDSFDYRLPIKKDALGGMTGAPIVVGSPLKGSASIPISGAPVSTLVFKAGDWVTFGAYNKLYMVTSDVTSDGFGLASVPIYPPLIENVTGGSSVNYDNIIMTVFAEDVLKYKMSQPGFFKVTLKLKEAI